MTVGQHSFATAILDPKQDVPPGLQDAQDRPAGRRFNVYRNNVAVSLTEAMHQAFPVVTKLLGPQNMDGLAGMFLRQHPPSSPLMMHYGAEFPAFLEGLDQLSHLGYLPDIARLELAIRRSYHAADSAAIDPADIGALEPEALMASRLAFARTVELVRSHWPIHDIWIFNTQPDAPKPQQAAQDILVTRPEFDPIPHLLPVGAARWIEHLMQGHSIGAAYEAVLSDHPDFDLGATLAILLQGSAITSLTTKG